MVQDGIARLHHFIEGPEDAPPLILSNSLGTSYRMWDSQARTLANRFRLLRYNHRGHEGSEVPPGPYTVGDIGRDLVALMDDLEIERASFCGLSLGGMVGMWLASEHPERIERLVLFCTTAHFENTEVWENRARAVREGGIEGIADSVIERWFTPPYLERDGEQIALARKMLVSTPNEGYANCCEAVRDVDLRESLNRISAPTRVVAASEDLATPPAHAEFIQTSIPNSRLVVVEDAAHIVAMERPEIVTALISEHLV